MKDQYKIIHFFRWRIEDIVNVLPQVKEQGFNAIQISPIQECREGYQWWLLYQPLSYYFGNYTGNLADVHNLCKEAEKYDIEIIADVLFHNVASLDGTDIHPDVDQKVAKYVIKDLPECKNYEDRYQTTHLKVGLPMVNYWISEVQNMHFECLEKLYHAGVKGFRIDQAKHFATSKEGCNYFEHVFLPFKDKGLFVYGEVLNASVDVINMYAEIMYVGTEWIKGNKNKVVTFVESHDEYYGIKNKQYLTKEMIVSKWNELVNVEKVHSLFFVRPMEDEKNLSNLWLSEEIKNINLGGK